MAKLVILRHGKSVWNEEGKFTGWIDIGLNEKGIKEAKKAGKKLSDFKFDIIYTSLLKRAQQTLEQVLRHNKNHKKYRYLHEKNDWYNHFEGESELVEIKPSEKLNERFYGDLQGKSKEEMRQIYGEEKVHQWRRSYEISPPNGESLKNTYDRVIPYFKEEIENNIKENKNILIVAHGNSLRAIMKYLEEISDEEIPQVELETGVPLVYDIEKNLKISNKEKL